MQDLRKNNEDNWHEIREFITESRLYRNKDQIMQKYQAENLEAVKNEVKIQNGRVFALEKFKEEIEVRLKQRKDNWAKIQAWVTIISAIAMSVSALYLMIKK